MRRVLVLVVVVLSVIAITAAPAAAHGDEAELRVAAWGANTERIDLVVDVFYEDGDPAVPEFLLTWVVDDEGNELTSTDEFRPGGRPGRYDVTVDAPGAGTWLVQMTSTNPVGVASIEIVADTAPKGGASAVFAVIGVALVGLALALFGVWMWRRDAEFAERGDRTGSDT